MISTEAREEPSLLEDHLYSILISVLETGLAVREEMEANNNNVGNNNNNNHDRDPLVNMRDRLFHTLFFRLSLAYAR